MTQGVVILAFNNTAIDYVAQAAWSAHRIHRHLDLPVTLITNADVTDSVFDKIINVESRLPTDRWFGDYQQTMPWYNANRADVYNLSPYDQTLILDSDYIVASDQLRTLFASGQDFLCHGRAVDAVDPDRSQHKNRFGKFNMPMKWATVIYYQRSDFAAGVFAMVDMIHSHWTHYRNVYGISNPTFRNDFAVSIAVHTVNGQFGDCGNIAWNLINAEPEHRLQQLGPDMFRIDFELNSQPRWITVSGQDFHAMNKQDLGAIIANT